MPLDLHFLVPGDLDTRTGGYGYDRAIISGLRARGWIVHVVSVPGAYPLPSDADRATAGRALAALPDDALVLADGLAYGALPLEAARQRARLRVVALVHHPLGLETGIDALTSLRLLGSERQALTNALGVVVTSARTVREVEALGVPLDRIEVVEPGTRVGEVARGGQGGPVQMLCVASIVPRKGQDVLFDALERLTAQEWHLTCVGRIDRESTYAADIVRRSGEASLSGRVTLAGELTGEALDAAYDTADLFVLPTHYEGYGMAVAEALSRAIPVVSSPTGAIVELVGSDAGVLVTAGDVTALAATLQTLLTDRSRLDALRQGALRARSALGTWDAACARMEEALTRFAQQ
jgi:glycosyltransferase involved in cell wall biosynthesis